MTATPIPRTVAMTVFGDLDVSTLTELPAGRSPIATHVVPSAREAALPRPDLAAGPRGGRGGPPGLRRLPADRRRRRRVPSDALPAASRDAADEASSALPAGRSPCSTSRRARRRTAGRAAGRGAARPAAGRREGRRDARGSPPASSTCSSRPPSSRSASTSPNATVMVVMDADRFGVSQLHQLRGRVGRGAAPGLCLLVTDAPRPDAGPGAARRGRRDHRRVRALPARPRDRAARATCSAPSQSGRRSSLRLLSRAARRGGHRRRRATRPRPLVADDPDLAGHPALRARSRPVLGRRARRATWRRREPADAAGDRRGGARPAARGAARPGDPADLRPRPRGAVLRRSSRWSIACAGAPGPRPVRRLRRGRARGAQPRRRPCAARRVRRRGRPAPIRAERRRPLGLAGAEVRHGRVERLAAAGAAPARRTTSCSPTRRTTLDDASLATVLADLRATAGCADGAVVVVERATRGGTWVWPAGFEAAAVPALRRGHALVRSRHSGRTGPRYRRRGEPSVTERRCVCPGSFDPVTNGHLDVIERAPPAVRRGRRSRCSSTPPRPACSASTSGSRCSRRSPPSCGNVRVDSFQGLLVDYCRAHDIPVIVKGLRAVSDFDYELQMAQMNHRLTGVETMFVATNPQYSFLSSSLVKEVAACGGDVVRAGARPGAAPACARRLDRSLTPTDPRPTRPRGPPPVDVHDKLDELIGIVEDARAMPMSASCIVNRGEVLGAARRDPRRCCPRSSGTRELLLADRDAGRRRGPAARPTGSSTGPQAERAASWSRRPRSWPRRERQAERIRNDAAEEARTDARRGRRLRRRQARELRGRAGQDAGRGPAGPGASCAAGPRTRTSPATGTRPLEPHPFDTETAAVTARAGFRSPGDRSGSLARGPRPAAEYVVPE